MIAAVRTFFFRALFTSFHTHASLLTVFICLFVLFHSCCSHVRMFGKTLVHEFPISYSHTEWSLRFSLFGARGTKQLWPIYRHCSWSGRWSHLIKKNVQDNIWFWKRLIDKLLMHNLHILIFVTALGPFCLCASWNVVPAFVMALSVQAFVPQNYVDLLLIILNFGRRYRQK